MEVIKSMLSDTFMPAVSTASKILLLSLFVACGKADTGDGLPSISLDSYEMSLDSNGKSDVLTLKLNFADSDGDIGYRKEDTIPPFDFQSPYFFNLHVDFYSVSGGQKTYYLNGTDTIRFSQRLQSITPEGKFKGISGTMDVRIGFDLLRILGYNPDNAQFEIWLNDRTLNRTSVVTTPVIDLDL